MWRAEEDDAVRGDIYRSRCLMVGIAEVVGVEQCALHQYAAETVGNPNDGVVARAPCPSKSSQVADKRHGMLIDKVVAGIGVCAPVEDVGIVAIDEDIGRALF